MKTYEIVKEVELNAVGVEGDIDGNWIEKATMHVVSEETSDSFNEYIADKSGYQDYSYRVSFITIAKNLTEEDMLLIHKSMERVILTHTPLIRGESHE